MAGIARLLQDAGLDLDDPPFTMLLPASSADDHWQPQQISYRPETDERWASLRYKLSVPHIHPGAEIVVKQWVNDWWPAPCPDLPLRDRGTLRWIPSCACTPHPAGPAWWTVGLDHHGTPGLTAHLHGTNVEVRLPDGMDPYDDQTAELLSRMSVAARGPPSWYTRAFHARRDIAERGWGDGLVTGLDWAPWASAPEHPGCPAPDLLVQAFLPNGWAIDATGARQNPRNDHHERQWIVVDQHNGNPLLWARAVPVTSRHRFPLLLRADTRYRLDWAETPIGWAGSLDPDHGHHVILLERGDLRIEVWIGLHAGLDRTHAAHLANDAFV